MIRILLISDCEYGKNGAVIQVKNNDAHSLIERKVAKLYHEKTYSDKMMRPRVYKKKIMKVRKYGLFDPHKNRKVS